MLDLELAVALKVVFLARLNIVVVDRNVIITIRPALLVMESKGV